jgi:hypothetical protein
MVFGKKKEEKTVDFSDPKVAKEVTEPEIEVAGEETTEESPFGEVAEKGEVMLTTLKLKVREDQYLQMSADIYKLVQKYGNNSLISLETRRGQEL